MAIALIMRLSLKQTIVLVLIAVFVIAGLYLKFREYVLPTAVIQIAGQEIKVELAQTPRAWAKGLSGRKNLDEKAGMFFVYPEPSRRGFWMKEMNFPLDIIWINEGQVVDIAPNVPPASDSNPPLYYPRLPAQGVLEVKAGFSEKYGLKIGDRVELLTK